MGASRRGSDLCVACGGQSQVENTERRDKNFVYRLRGCIDCGNTWGTAEINLLHYRTLLTVNKMVEEINAYKAKKSVPSR